MVKSEERAIEQNNRMREWFKSRTGLDSTLLSEHMTEVDRLLDMPVNDLSENREESA